MKIIKYDCKRKRENGRRGPQCHPKNLGPNKEIKDINNTIKIRVINRYVQRLLFLIVAINKEQRISNSIMDILSFFS